MTATYDTVIVGAGVAGVCTALHLSSRERVLVVDQGEASSRASAVAAGLVNPFMARKARPVWRHRQALEALAEVLELAGARDLFDLSGVFRPASDHEQMRYFRETAAAHPSCAYLDVDATTERWDAVHAPLGGLLVPHGGAVDLPAFLERAVVALQQSSADFITGCHVDSVQTDAEEALLEFNGGDTLRAKRVILAAGAGISRIRGVPKLNLHPIKGQILEIPRAGTPYAGAEIPHLAGRGYVVAGSTNFTLGSSYRHSFEDLEPEREVSRDILDRTCNMLPGLKKAAVLREAAGVRVTVPGTRLPMVGPLPKMPRVWILTGLGSKGLLMGPLLAKNLPDYLDNPVAIPEPLRVH